MSRDHEKWCILLVALLIMCSCHADETEESVLRELYNVTDGANWNKNTNWNTSSPLCTWYGVTCLQDQVVELDLSSNNVTGSLMFVNFSVFTSLKTFLARDNNIEGMVPMELLYIPSISRVDLRNNVFTRFPPVEPHGLPAAVPNSLLTMAGNSIWCPVPEYVKDVLELWATDWNATYCAPVQESRSRTLQVTRTVQIEPPVPPTAAVAGFNETIASIMYLTDERFGFTPKTTYEKKAKAIIFEILSRTQLNAPTPLPSDSTVENENTLFAFGARTFRSQRWARIVFNYTVNDEHRRDLANRLFSDHESIWALRASDVLLVDVEETQLVVTVAPTSAPVTGEIDNKDSNTHIIVASVLVFALLVVVGIFICYKTNRFGRANMYAPTAQPGAPGQMPPGGGQEMKAQPSGMFPPPNQPGMVSGQFPPQPGQQMPPPPGQQMPPQQPQQFATQPSGQFAPQPSQQFTPQPSQHFAPPNQPGPPPGHQAPPPPLGNQAPGRPPLQPPPPQ